MKTNKIVIYSKTSDSGKNCYHIRLPMLLSIENNHNILIIGTCLITTNRMVYKFRSGTKLPRWAKVTPYYGIFLLKYILYNDNFKIIRN